ncbi:MFS transporter [Actinoalloteichus hymeniacidonis]|uniref:Major Facilitator Superfamily transporter n=1 Tax=Actinoalloteichus hymeniacidonis TaxID=340345 RepID=A0AAC9MYH6_9PSEU|nr:MFS transporter [Actinoalloteichus hymeniacidonis]AOS63464.1 Major Facilitator Superfamily transporter [Actinoalloteichus hymeniacidonis]MBB5908494.1 DHA2 family multidrug resistance protein-like MFS transporter [Actinoalloteichus hymeniacidonis]
MTQSNPPRRAGRREWLGLVVLTLPTLLLAMDMTVLHLAVPALSADLAPSGTQLLWIVDIYGFLIAGFLVTMGAIGDRIGRRRLLLWGAVAFGAGSVLAAFSDSAEMLIATRALLGIAGATLMPSTLSLIRAMFEDSQQRRVAIGAWMACFTVGAAVGPLAGGLLLERFWWGSVFLLGVPVMLVLLVSGPLVLPEQRDPTAGRLDLFSAVLSLAAVLLMVAGLKSLAADGAQWPQGITLLVGLALGVLFVRRQYTLTHPLLDPTLFRSSAFSVSLAAQTLAIFAMAGLQFFAAQYLQLILGLTPLQAGLWMVPSMAAATAGTLLVPLIMRRTARVAPVMTAGLALAAVGGLIVSMVGDSPDSGVWTLVLGFVLISLGLGPTMTLATDQIMGAVPAHRGGAAAAISETGGELGTALGIALLGSLGGAIYRIGVGDTLAGLSTADAARDSLSGAVLTAQRLPAAEAEPMLAAARTAFVDGMQVTALASTAMVLGIAVLVAMILRPGPKHTEPDAQTAPVS